MASEIAELVTPALEVPTNQEGNNIIATSSSMEKMGNKQKIINGFYQTSIFYMLLIIVIGGVSTDFYGEVYLHDKKVKELNQEDKSYLYNNTFGFI